MAEQFPKDISAERTLYCCLIPIKYKYFEYFIYRWMDIVMSESELGVILGKAWVCAFVQGPSYRNISIVAILGDLRVIIDVGAFRNLRSSEVIHHSVFIGISLMDSSPWLFSNPRLFISFIFKFFLEFFDFLLFLLNFWLNGGWVSLWLWYLYLNVGISPSALLSPILVASPSAASSQKNTKKSKN